MSESHTHTRHTFTPKRHHSWLQQFEKMGCLWSTAACVVVVNNNINTPTEHPLKREADLRMSLHCAANDRYEQAFGEYQCFDFTEMASKRFNDACGAYGLAINAERIAYAQMEKARLDWHKQDRADLIPILVVTLGNEMGMPDDLVTIVGQYMTENIDAKRYPLSRTQHPLHILNCVI